MPVLVVAPDRSTRAEHFLLHAGNGVGVPDDVLGREDALDRANKLRAKRDDARWYIIVGVAMLFAGSISAYIAAGGAAMCVWGLGSYAYWNRRAKSAYDPWKDEELDEWEEDQYG